MKKYILALDQGTTSSRAIVFDHNGQICSVAQKEFTQYFPKPGWVEHNPNEIWSSEASVIAEAISAIDINGLDIAAIGITNQRETTIVWDIDTEEPIYNAIVWQDRRTAEFCDKLKAQGLVDKIREKTGLIIDAYFSGTKIKWILDNVPGARERAEKGKLRFGNVDSWLIWRLTRGEVHVTDVTNASRTMLFNINTLQWDDDLLKLLDIPRSMMPEVKSSSEVYGHTKTTIFAHEVPIAGIAGDQQSALFGQMCLTPGSIKNTYGTGCFVMLNIGDKPILSKNNLLTTVAWKIGDKVKCWRQRRPVAARRSRVHQEQRRDRGACFLCTRQWRCLLRSGAHRSGRSLLGSVRPRHDRRYHPWHDPRAHRTRCPRRHRLPDLRHRSGHGKRHECSSDRAEGRRRC